MSDKFDKELEELFPEELSRVNLKQVVKKARVFTILRTTVISAVASVIVLFGAFLVNIQLLNISRNKLQSSLIVEKKISGPNIYLGNENMHDGWFGGQLQVQTYKVIEGVPVSWSTEMYEYNFFGGFSYVPGSYGPSPQLSTPTGMREYNSQTEQREMTFYHPDINYDHYLNDLPLLKYVPSSDFVEMAISFNKSYDFNQIRSMLPMNVHPTWYWVNTYSNQDIKLRSQMPDTPPMESYEVYGFENKAFVDSPSNQTPKGFVDAIKNGLKIHGSFQGEFEQIYDVLSHGKGSINPSDIKIIGIVVTGTPKDLMTLESKSFVKAAVLGAIANPY